VAHEALIREWPTLRTWLEENREGLRLHRHLTEAAQEWHNADRESDLLYRGVRLMQAREWAGQNLDEMNPQEREFIIASVQRQEQETAERELQQQRELEAVQRLAEAETKRAEEQTSNARQLRKRSYFLVGALIITLILVATSLILAAQARQASATAQSQERVAFSRELAAAAVTNLDVDPERSILLAIEAVSSTYSVDKTWTREAENALRRSLQSSHIELVLRGHNDLISGAVFSSDGSRIATTSDDGTARIWDAQTGAELLSLRTDVTNAVHGVAFSPDGKLLATAGKNGTAIIWNASTGEKMFNMVGHSDEVAGFDFSPDGKWLATASEDRTVKIWNTLNGKEKLMLTGHFGEVWYVVFSPDGKKLATASNDGSARIWDATTGERLLTISNDETSLYNVGYNSDGSRLITSGVNRRAQVWDATSGELILVLDGHIGPVSSAVFSPDDTLIATSSDDGSIIVWDAETGRQKFIFKGHTQVVFSVSFSPVCIKNELVFPHTCWFRLVSASGDGTARVWSTAPDRELLTLAVPDIFRTIISPDGSLMATGFDDGSAKTYNISTVLAEAFKGKSSDTFGLEEVNKYCCHSAQVNDLVFSPDGVILATASDDHTVKLWDVATGQELQTLTGYASGVEAVILTSNGTQVATYSSASIQISDLTEKPAREVAVIDVRSGIEDFKFSPDGKRIAVALSNGTVVVFDALTGEKIYSMRPQFGQVSSIAYSPNGAWLATAGGGDSIDLWDANTGVLSTSLKTRSGAVRAAVFSPNGDEITGLGLDQTTKIWNVALGQEIATLTGHTDFIMGASFHPNCRDSADPYCGTWLATKSIDGTFRFYLTHLEDLTSLARARVTRPLSSSECMEFLHRSQTECTQDLPQVAGISPANSPILDALSPSSEKKVCQVTNMSGVNDQFFNQITYSGVKKAAELFQWETSLIESAIASDYGRNIQAFVDDQCSLIVVPMGFDMANDVETAAKATPQEKFIIMDINFDQSYENVWAEVYATDQAGFLAGYAAAAVTKTGKVGTYGGYNFRSVVDFMNGFALGVQYYNDKNDAIVQVIGWDLEKQDGIFINSFDDLVAGRAVTNQLLDQGVDVILPVAGNVGLVTAEALIQRGEGLLIGVDTDWAVTFPEHAGVILTSIEKRMDNTVVNAVRAIVEGNFTGGTHVGTLANGGVSLAPFHQLDSLVSAQVKADLKQIEMDIIAGKIKTMP
jgi:WD40 repeat protein/basic membrane lipoprotein Med (substrate-binding protein (PBP1-ABC) superfamily)